jgi:NAD(P)-dependent dehydrogenase (short-subunit alcohol dehydrogenase family)
VTSKPFLETPLDEIAAQVQVNVAGALQLTRLLAPGMVARGRGSVVNISSLAGYKPNTAQTVYSITKSAVNAMSLILRRELAPHGVHVMNVATPQIGVEPGLLDPARFVAAVAQGIESGTDELFLHRRSKWLMRLYAAFPGLMAWR